MKTQAMQGLREEGGVDEVQEAYKNIILWCPLHRPDTYLPTQGVGVGAALGVIKGGFRTGGKSAQGNQCQIGECYVT